MTMSDVGTPLFLNRYQKLALIVGAVGLVVLGIGWFTDRHQFLHSYLYAYVFWVGIPAGSLALLMLQHLTGGGWGLVIRRPLEAATRTLPLMLILLLPIVLGIHELYPWSHEAEIAKLQDKTRYLNTPGFIIRSIICFSIWMVLAYFLNSWSREQDKTANRAYAKRMRILSGPGMVLFVFTVTVVAVDWVMSLDPEWMSTMFGLLFVAAWGVSALAFVIAALAVLAEHEPLNHLVGPRHFHDLGKLLLALVMLWTYFAFSQYLIIWSGDLPEEIRYYLPRTRSGWGVVVLIVAILHFAAPFLFLLSRSVKRDARKLVVVAVLILVMRLVDFLWMVAPHHTGPQFHVSWMDLVAPVAIGGLWLAAYFWQLKTRVLVALNDPQYESVLEQARAGGH
ncbi:MAG TPA: hypothetical protein VJ023_10995 [Pyrinomonadaceae bacterium]|nr:hypothetical protein [Pyrinomonadaceae bacterium]